MQLNCNLSLALFITYSGNKASKEKKLAEFSKLLTNTDIQKRLSLPTKFFKSLPSFNGGHAVSFQAMDESGFVWTFKCSTRKKGHPKPVLSKGWLAFVRNKKLQVGDTIKFSILDQTALLEKEVEIFALLWYQLFLWMGPFAWFDVTTIRSGNGRDFSILSLNSATLAAFSSMMYYCIFRSVMNSLDAVRRVLCTSISSRISSSFS
ncbi:hypothetical protein SADUNF_Sadunf12G0014300 [Salix dunnii]|uniref:TF-B3 domain-containing protein n=1 Tax=Salix dunnii TaxID=1413687 RepID=A0A835JM80_9ROSI|nr:hypothetical protein SADUNF_Sadunf12G0014300 [Salix dunnii]